MIEASDPKSWDFLFGLGNRTIPQVLHDNQLLGGILKSRCSMSGNLETLYLGDDRLSGEVPQSIGGPYRLNCT
jgi:hypothetical protein